MGASTDEIADQLAATRADADEKIGVLSERVERAARAALPRALGVATMAAGFAMIGLGALQAVRVRRRPSLRDDVAARLSGAGEAAAGLCQAIRHGLPPVQLTVGRQDGRQPTFAMAGRLAGRVARSAGAAAGSAAASRLLPRRR